MKIASFNVNSINRRAGIVGDFLKKQDIDILLLQEIKCIETNFPSLEFSQLGYNSYVVGQKTYNGVAILSKTELEIISSQLPYFEDDAARYIQVKTTNDVNIICVYVPNGNPVASEKFPYKLGWLKAFYQYCSDLISSKQSIIIGGDFNIIPRESDAYDINKFIGDALYHEDIIAIFREIIALGFTDIWQVFNKKQDFSYYDFFANNFEMNRGLRIDHFLVSPVIADRSMNCYIDKEPRSETKPSDHTPIILEVLND